MEKHCRVCGQTKPTTEFHKDKSKTDGLNLYCKPCTIARQKEFATRPPRNPAPEGMKRCNMCKETKLLDLFDKSAVTHDGRGKRCKACSYEHHKKWRSKNRERANEMRSEWGKKNRERDRDFKRRHYYGLELGQFAKMLEAQNGKCAICFGTDSGPRGFHVDHCHDTGKVRGLLCHGCNVSLGHFKHDAEVLTSAINYLAKSRAES